MNIATTVYQVQFGYGRTNFALPDEIKDTLIAAAISARRINLRGRTDSKIADEANKRVAIERAFAARRFLITNGVDPHRIRLYALAAGDFIAPNSTKEGRAKNRRVEIELIDVGAYPAAMAKRYTKN